MLGIAVVNAPSADGPLAVWLVSRMSASEAAATNAVVWTPESLAEAGAVAKLRGMLEDRFVMLAAGSDTDALADLLGEPVPVCDVDELRRAVSEGIATMQDRFGEAMAQRRSAKKPSLVEPTWPQLPTPEGREAAEKRIEASEPGRSALILATDVARTWTTWLALETLLSARSCLAREPETAGSLPEAFMSSATVMPFHAPKQ